jgi:hypothetical protein
MKASLFFGFGFLDPASESLVIQINMKRQHKIIDFIGFLIKCLQNDNAPEGELQRFYLTSYKVI